MNEKLEQLLSHLETFLPKQLTEEQWKSSTAFRWRRRDSIFGSIGFLQPVKHVADISFEDLKNIDRQRDAIIDNTRHFVEKKPANNILLTGARGTGKSSLIKACLNEFASQGLRLVEVDKDHLADLPDRMQAGIQEACCPVEEQFSSKLCLMTIASRYHPFPSRTGP